MPNSYPKFEPNLHHFNALPPPCFYKQTLSQLDTSQKNAGKLGKLTKMPWNLGLPFMDRFWNGQPGFDVVLHATWLYSIHGRDVEKSQVNIYQMPLWFVCLFGTSRCSQFFVGDVPLGMLRLSILQHVVRRNFKAWNTALASSSLVVFCIQTMPGVHRTHTQISFKWHQTVCFLGSKIWKLLVGVHHSWYHP